MIGVGEAGKQEKLRPVLAEKEFATNFQRTFTEKLECRKEDPFMCAVRKSHLKG